MFSTNSIKNKLSLNIIILLIFIGISSIAFSLEEPPKLNMNKFIELNSTDSLILINSKNGNEFVIPFDQPIRIWSNKTMYNGSFQKIENNIIYISSFGSITEIPIESISKIKIFKGLGRRFLGGGVKVWGYLIVGAGVLAPFITGEILALIITVPAVGVGLGIVAIGNLIKGDKKFNLEKNWKIKTSDN